MVQYSKCPYGLFSYCKSQAFTLNTLWGVCKIYAKKHIFRFSKEGGGGGGQLWYIFKFVLSLCNQISFSTFDLRFALLVPPQSENASYAPEQVCRKSTTEEIRFIVWIGVCQWPKSHAILMGIWKCVTLLLKLVIIILF